VFQPTLLLFAAGEQRVITMALMGKIRGMYFRDKKSISEIARLTSLSRNTIKRWLRAAPGTQPKYRRGEVTTKLTPFAAALTKALETDAHRPRRERRTARALHAQLKVEGYTGGYTRLTDFIRDWRHAEGKTFKTNAFVPLKFGLGEAFQFDWSEEGLVDAKRRRLNVAALSALRSSVQGCDQQMPIGRNANGRST
jgi:transposase-like protein